MIAKHEEARILVDQYRREGMTLQQAAPQIVGALSGIGLRVTVFDLKGRYLAGDKTLRPKPLAAVLAAGGMQHFIPASRGHRDAYPPLPPDPTRLEPLSLTYVEGGYVGFEPSFPLLLVSLIPYWRIVITIALAAMLLSWFVGRLFAQQSLRPINEVSDSLQALADGDYTQRRFVMAGGDEIASLTGAFNDAAASVAYRDRSPPAGRRAHAPVCRRRLARAAHAADGHRRLY